MDLNGRHTEAYTISFFGWDVSPSYVVKATYVVKVKSEIYSFESKEKVIKSTIKSTNYWSYNNRRKFYENGKWKRRTNTPKNQLKFDDYFR